ncbi:retrovirus-related pol polyprotein from transposon TNT 1-94 [Tanacetum coccineum]
MVNPLNSRNPTAARGACYECGGTDHYKAACPRLNQAPINEEIVQIKLWLLREVKVVGTIKSIRDGSRGSSPGPEHYDGCMELYMENRENGRMILDSVQNGPLVWPTIVEENGTTRKKKYEELSVFEKLQADCDLKATNIVLQGLPPDVYAIVNHHKVDKEIWDRVKLLMQGTKLSLQEREYKLYGEFDKFSFVKGETLYHLPQEWSKFVTDVLLFLCLLKEMILSAVAASSYDGTGYKGNATSFGGNNTRGHARVVKCYNYQGEGHMARQCTQPKRTRNAAWFKEKAMLAEAQESGQILDEEQLAFLADPGISDGQAA